MGVGIEVKDLNAWFGKAQVLKEINIKVGANAVTAVIGPSGCGKSTFIRCLNRMHEIVPEARLTGSVQVGDMDIYDSGQDASMCAAASVWSSRSRIRFRPCRSMTMSPPDSG